LQAERNGLRKIEPCLVLPDSSTPIGVQIKSFDEEEVEPTPPGLMRHLISKVKGVKH
jgi:hypothetical protein